jgi:hypothetical protein
VYDQSGAPEPHARHVAMLGRRMFALCLLVAMLAEVTLGPRWVSRANAEVAPPSAGQVADVSTCLLNQAAFCDTFNEGPSTAGGRSGALDPARWSVSHVTGLTNFGQDQANGFVPSDYMRCMDPETGLLPPNDYFMCAAAMPDGSKESMHFMEAFNDAGNYDYDSAMVRQPFDFAGRSGTIAFDVDAKTDGGHMWWPEIWVTDQPIPAPHVNTLLTLPRNGIGVALSDAGPPRKPLSLDATGSGLGNVGAVTVVRDYQPTDLGPGNGVNETGFYKTEPDSRNRFQIRLSQDDLQVWATDADGTDFREVADAPGIGLNFTRGYVSIQHADYNPEKYGITGQVTYHWDNVGFDGPVLPADRGYSVPDALTPAGGGGLNLGYIIDPQGIGTCCTAPRAPFALDGVDPAGAVEADLTLDVWDFASTAADTLTYRVNGGAPTTVPYPPPIAPKWGAPTALVLPVPLSDVQNGANTISLAASEPLMAANIDLVLRMSAPSDPGAAPAPSPSPTATTTATATPNAMTTSTVAMPPAVPAGATASVGASENDPTLHPQFVQETHFAQSSVSPGGSVALTTAFTDTAGSLPHGLADVEVYDSGNRKVGQFVVADTGTRFVPGGSVTVAGTWTAPAAPGVYTVRAGVWGPNWAGRYMWTDNAATITVR